MSWIRIYPYLTNWPVDTAPPLFDISSDTPGEAVVELAWDPQALLAPATYPDPLRYLTNGLDLNVTLVAVDGSSHPLSIPAAPVAVSGTATRWAIPSALWKAYGDEARKAAANPPSTTFSRNLYYRVRLAPPGGSTGVVWPSEDVLNGDNASGAPRIGILVGPAQPPGGSLPDADAVAAVGGTAAAPTAWADIVTWLWQSLPQTDPHRQALQAIFAHPAFTSREVAARGQILKLWLLAGPASRPGLAQLLDAQVDLSKLVPALLAVADIAPGPDVVSVLAKEQLVDDVLTEILDPNGQLDVGSAGSATPTCLLAWLATTRPAELAGLAAGWLSSAASATLAGGQTAPVPAGVFAASAFATAAGDNVFLLRTNTELAFEAAVLAAGQNGRFPALSGDAATANTAFQGAVAGGLSLGETATMVSALFGSAAAAQQVALPARPFDPTWRASQATLRDALLAELDAGKQVVAHLFWGQPGSETAPTHPVLMLSHESDMVLFCNAQYAGSAAPAFAIAGGTSGTPPRVYQDPARRLESMSVADLADWLVAYVAPASPIT